MDEDNQDLEHVEKILKSAFNKQRRIVFIEKTLRELFTERLEVLEISASTAAVEILNVEWRGLNGILDGTQKRVDFTALTKLARFLNLSNGDVVELYLNSLSKNYENEIHNSEKSNFIIKNFDLATLKKAGIIEGINEFDDIAGTLTTLLDLPDILKYDRSKIHVAFSSGKIEPKNSLTRDFWTLYAEAEFQEYKNPFHYNRQDLIDFFPEIRHHSLNVELGLFNVTRELFRLGVTVIFQPSLPGMHVRGATFAVNDKPCVVITDYKGYYPTLWFALVHELFHVLFDWEELRINNYHLSVENSEDYNHRKREDEANSFARKYLFSDDKLAEVIGNINDKFFIDRIAEQQSVHPSIIRVFYAFDKGKEDLKAWPIFRANIPLIKSSLIPLHYYEWSQCKPVREVARIRKKLLFNNLTNVYAE